MLVQLKNYLYEKTQVCYIKANYFTSYPWKLHNRLPRWVLMMCIHVCDVSLRPVQALTPLNKNCAKTVIDIFSNCLSPSICKEDCINERTCVLLFLGVRNPGPETCLNFFHGHVIFCHQNIQNVLKIMKVKCMQAWPRRGPGEEHRNRFRDSTC